MENMMKMEIKSAFPVWKKLDPIFGAIPFCSNKKGSSDGYLINYRIIFMLFSVFLSFFCPFFYPSFLFFIFILNLYSSFLFSIFILHFYSFILVLHLLLYFYIPVRSHFQAMLKPNINLNFNWEFGYHHRCDRHCKFLQKCRYEECILAKEGNQNIIEPTFWF